MGGGVTGDRGEGGGAVEVGGRGSPHNSDVLLYHGEKMPAIAEIKSMFVILKHQFYEN